MASTTSRLRYRALPLIASPLEQEEHSQNHEHGQPGYTPASADYAVSKEQSKVDVRGAHNEAPEFREKEVANTIELFYDLFFVANLTSFTTVHAIDDSQTISSYIGFFTLLWFTWLQVVLYDVRFGVDSLFERICKLFHFGIFIAFAVVGTRFDPSSQMENFGTFRQFSMILFISRLVLLLQYGQILFWVKGHRKIITPVLIHMAAFAIGAIICLGVLFTFSSTAVHNAYLVWYVIAVLEALAVFISSSQWRGLSFKRTNLNERCGLLTLIILGEGIIVLTKSMNYVTKGENYSPAIIGQIISAVCIIYFVYMLYFDQVDAKRFGTIRQQFWALCHFPFHVALVLLLEGTSRFITWRNANEVVDQITTDLDAVWDSSNDTSVLADDFSIVTEGFLKVLEADPTKYDITPYLVELKNSTEAYSDQAIYATSNIIDTLLSATFKYFKIEASKSDRKKSASDVNAKDPFSDIYSALEVYDLVFTYFFLAAGFTLITMAILICLAKKGKCAGDYAAIGLRLSIGALLACIAALHHNENAQWHFLYTPWMLPTVLFGFLIVVVADGVLGYVLPAPKPIAPSRHISELSLHQHTST